MINIYSIRLSLSKCSYYQLSNIRSTLGTLADRKEGGFDPASAFGFSLKELPGTVRATGDT